ncbi:TPA: hypothetical protein ACH3X1_009218 [Trebouxia sp. C0004]
MSVSITPVSYLAHMASHTAFIQLAQYDYIPMSTPVSYPAHTDMLPGMIPHRAVGEVICWAEAAQGPRVVEFSEHALRACQRLKTKIDSGSGASVRVLTEGLPVVVYDVPTTASE